VAIPTYERVSLDEDLNEDTPIVEKSRWVKLIATDGNRTSKRILVLAAITIILMAGLIVASFTNHIPGKYVRVETISQHNTFRPDFKDGDNGPIELAGNYRCGSFPSEARDRNCTFDFMSYGYTAPECFYPDLYEEALAAGSWKWYFDPEATLEVPQDPRIMMSVVELYGELGWQIEHCKYVNLVKVED